MRTTKLFRLCEWGKAPYSGTYFFSIIIKGKKKTVQTNNEDLYNKIEELRNKLSKTGDLPKGMKAALLELKEEVLTNY